MPASVVDIELLDDGRVELHMSEPGRRLSAIIEKTHNYVAMALMLRGRHDEANPVDRAFGRAAAWRER